MGESLSRSSEKFRQLEFYSHPMFYEFGPRAQFPEPKIESKIPPGGMSLT